MASQKAQKTNRTTGGEKIGEFRKTTMKWMGCKQGQRTARHRARRRTPSTGRRAAIAKAQADLGKIERIRITQTADHVS
jgi:hypothetical protein